MGELARVSTGALVLLERIADAGGRRSSLGLVSRGRSSAASSGSTGRLGLIPLGSGGGGCSSRIAGGSSGIRLLLLGRTVAAEASDFTGLSALLASNGLILKLLLAVKLLFTGRKHPVFVAVLYRCRFKNV